MVVFPKGMSLPHVAPPSPPPIVFGDEVIIGLGVTSDKNKAENSIGCMPLAPPQLLSHLPPCTASNSVTGCFAAEPPHEET